MTITVRSLASAYDPPDDEVCVATPTCCCCCCCCLATATGTSMFLGTEAYYHAIEQPATHPRRWWLFVLGFLSIFGVPIALSAVAEEIAGSGFLVAPILGWAALVLAGTRKRTAALILVATYAIGAALFAVEFGLAIATAFLIELTFPLAMWLAWWIARRRHRRRMPAMPPHPVPPPHRLPPPTVP